VRKPYYILMTICALIAFVGAVWSTPGTFVGAKTGAPGEGNCIDCHVGVVNAGSGSAGLIVASEYVPEDTLDVFVSVDNVGMERWGFQITALDGSNQPAGQFVITDALVTQTNTDGGTGRQYVFQTSEGTYSGIMDTSLGWAFRWVAPVTGTGDVTFWLNGLAANAAIGASGDSTYAASRTITEAISVGIGDDMTVRPLEFSLAQNYPNPFNPSTEIAYQLSNPAAVDLSIYNTLGERVRVLERAAKSAGLYTLVWDGRDDAGRAVGSGVYLYRLSVDGRAEMRKMVLLK
jgi:hypothetical protein